METRANYVLIGAFTLAVIAAAFGFVLWFQSLHTTKQRSPIRIVFEGPASGLRNGGSVNFQRYPDRGGCLGQARQSAARGRTRDG
jgi:phospholipid/cholesterol/gamma-HCH transport system substrate-binding protein